MKEIFRSYLEERKFVITNEKFILWTSLFIPKKIKKGDILFHEGEVCKYISFVAKGCLRLYTVDNKGREHIMQFAPENWWIGDIDSFSKSTPSLYFLDALEESEILQIDYPSQERVLAEIPGAAIFFQRLMQNRQSATQKRIIFSMSASAEERYFDFLKMYPNLSQRIPQHMIASYLGITAESLSRIRKQAVARK